MDTPDIDADMMEDALIRFRDSAEQMSRNKSNGTFEKIKNGNSAAAYLWATQMRQAGFTYNQTFRVVNNRTGIEVAEWDELVRDGWRK